MDLNDVKTKLQELTDTVAALKQSAIDEIARLEGVIAALQAIIAAGGDPTQIPAIIDTIQQSIDNLKGTKAQLDAEQPAPPAQAAGA